MKGRPLSPAAFRRVLYAHFRMHARDFPWRRTKDPYRILVSEVMLQQTQTVRVVGYYEAFLGRFPTLEALARAPLGEVLRMWQGLGYNRRAKMLHELAKEVVARYRGNIPREEHLLRSLPGIGPYTAGAIRAFAWNEPAVFLDTNVRTVFTHFFFPGTHKVADRDILLLVEKTMDTHHPRTWYSALMDYGAFLKESGVKNNMRRKGYVRQKPFKGSLREIRGRVIRELAKGAQSASYLLALFPGRSKEVERALEALEREEMIVRKKRTFTLL